MNLCPILSVSSRLNHFKFDRTFVSSSNLTGRGSVLTFFDLVMSGAGFFLRKLLTVGEHEDWAEAAILKRTFAAQVHTMVVLSQKEISDLQAEWDVPSFHELWVEIQSLEKVAHSVLSGLPLPFHVPLPAGEDWPVRNLTPGQKEIGKQLGVELKRAWAQVQPDIWKQLRFYKAVDNLSELLAAIGESLHWDAAGVYGVFLQRALGHPPGSSA